MALGNNVYLAYNKYKYITFNLPIVDLTGQGMEGCAKGGYTSISVKLVNSLCATFHTPRYR